MASVAQTVDGSIHTTGGAWQVTDATITCDRSRAPQIEATATLEGPPRAVVDALFSGAEIMLVIEVRAFDGGTLADLAETWAGQELGSLRFSAVPTRHRPYGTSYQATTSPAWRYRAVRLWPADGMRWDRIAQRLELRATSVEGVLQQRMCLDPSGWLANGTRTSRDDLPTLEGIVRQVTSHVGVPLPVARPSSGSGSSRADRPYRDPETGSTTPPLWEVGQTAWDYIDSLRATCNVSHWIDPASGDAWFTAARPEADVARSPDAPIEWSTDQSPLDAEGGFADAIAATFRWQEWDSTRLEVVDREQVMVELADGIEDWRLARAPVAVDYAGRPNRGLVQRDLRLRNLTRYLTATTEAFGSEMRSTSTRNPFARWFDIDAAWTQESVTLSLPDATSTVTKRETTRLP